MTEDENSRSTLDRIRAKKQEVAPETGYQLVEWDLMKPPEDQIMKRSQWWLILSAVSVPERTEFSDWSVFDRYANDYVTPHFEDLPDEPEPEQVTEALKTINQGDPDGVRIELVRLRRLAEQQPTACEQAVPVLADTLPDADRAVQAEIIGIYRELAEADPTLIHSEVDVVGELLAPEVHDRLRKDAITVLTHIAEANPSAITDVVPRLEVLLKDDVGDTDQILRLLTRTAEGHPEAVLPVLSTVIGYTTDPSNDHRVGALAVLGHVSKTYPNAATDVISTAHELLTTDSDRLRANAAGLLADLADQYPEEVLPVVAEAIELLEDEDEYTRYNATSILARVAKHDPEAVEPATAALIEALSEDRAEARENACWALGYIEATAATEALTIRAESDTNERVQKTASWAFGEIDGT